MHYMPSNVFNALVKGIVDRFNEIPDDDVACGGYDRLYDAVDDCLIWDCDVWGVLERLDSTCERWEDCTPRERAIELLANHLVEEYGVLEDLED